jgi:hypothetical protein
MSDYDIVREACIRSNPDIVELKDGCIIKIWWIDYLQDIKNGKDPDEITAFCERSMRDNGYVDGYYRGVIEDNVTGTIEILGRPIRLADVVLAITEIRDATKTEKIDWYYTHVAGWWNLSTDDLSRQSPHTLKLLADLLPHEPRTADLLPGLREAAQRIGSKARELFRLVRGF